MINKDLTNLQREASGGSNKSSQKIKGIIIEIIQGRFIIITDNFKKSITKRTKVK